MCFLGIPTLWRLFSNVLLLVIPILFLPFRNHLLSLIAELVLTIGQGHNFNILLKLLFHFHVGRFLIYYLLIIKCIFGDFELPVAFFHLSQVRVRFLIKKPISNFIFCSMYFGLISISHISYKFFENERMSTNF